MLKFFLWLRYLRKKKIVILSILAVALSVALLIVVDSLFTGFIQAMQQDYTEQSGDIFLRPSRPIPQYDALIDKLEDLEQVKASAVCVFGFEGALLHLETGDVREVMIRGIEPTHEQRFTDWTKTLLRQYGAKEDLNFKVPGYPDDIGGWVGINIVAEPDDKTDEYDRQEVRELIGKQVVLTTSAMVNTQLDGQQAKLKPKYLKLRISDVAFTQTFHGDKTLYIPFEQFNRLQFGDEQAEAARSIKIKLEDAVDAELAKGSIYKTFKQFAVEQLGWPDEVAERTQIIVVRQELENNEYFMELNKQRAILLLIFGVICSVAVLLIFCIFYMIVITKKKDIAIIKSCGAAAGTAVMIFIGFGACVGVVGSALGIFIGYIITSNINILENLVSVLFGLKLWRSSSYILNMIPDQVNWPAVWPITLAAVIGCVIGALIPAVIAARTRPVEILRYE